MRVLIACAHTEIERDAFEALGHDAWSCDLKPANGKHYQGDVRDILEDGWDLMIAHPECKYLTSSGMWAFNDNPMLNGKPRKVKPGTLIGAPRRQAREDALAFVQLLMDAPIPKIAIENPVGIISTRIRHPEQYIQPYEYGEDACKKTGLWLKNLPPLKPTGRFNGRMVEWPRGSGQMVERWGNQVDSGHWKLGSKTHDRASKIARTYQGWADAMADQWGTNLHTYPGKVTN